MSPTAIVSGAITVAVVAALLARVEVAPRRLADPTRERGSPTTTGRRRSGAPAGRGLLGAVAGLAGFVLMGPMAPLTGAALWWTLHRTRPVLDERRRRRAVHAALPDTVDLLVLIIRSGLTPHLAVRAMARRAPPASRRGFVRVVRRLDRGSVLADALGVLVECTAPSYAAIADALATSERHGTPLAPVLDQLALEARRRRRADAEADARTLPVRLSFPLVVCILPAFVLVAIAPAVMAALSSLGSPPW